MWFSIEIMALIQLDSYLVTFKRNKVLFVLAIISTVLLPPVLVTTSTPSKYVGVLKEIPAQPKGVYFQPGDINIGSFITYAEAYGGTTCSGEPIASSLTLEFSESVTFAVKKINENPKLLPNVTLGFVQLEDCYAPNVALAKSLSFLPRLKSNLKVDKSYSSLPKASPTNVSFEETGGYELPMPHYDVIGVLSPGSSDSTILVSHLFATAGIPLVGAVATSDELSNKLAHPYFVRVHAPDKYQVEAMLSFIESKGWSYISVLYIRGSYGDKAFDHIKDNVANYGICIATKHRVDSNTNFESVVEDLLNHRRARVVIMFVSVTIVKKVFKTVNYFKANGQFIWIGSDMWSSGLLLLKEYPENVLGSFVVLYHSISVTEFYRHIQQMRVNNTNNPWFKVIWEKLVGCSLDDESCDQGSDILKSDLFGFFKRTSLVMDSVLALAHAAHNLITDLCPNAAGTYANDCIQRNDLLSYLKNVSFSGYSGNISFDENGDMLGLFDISQTVDEFGSVQSENVSSTLDFDTKMVAVYDVYTKTTNDTAHEIDWSHLVQRDRVVPLPYSKSPSGTPESVCSSPCGVGEFKIQRASKCCWGCQKCRDNEKLINGNTSCQACEDLTWPDPDTNMTSCSAIPLSYPSVSDTLPVIQISLALAAIICASLTVIGYIYFRDVRVIKAASRELSVPQIVAIFIGYVTVLLFQTTPTSGTCGALFFLFCLSFAGLYSPLLVKTVRIYRIFQSGIKNNRRPRFVSPKSQLIVTAILIGIQVVLCLFVYSSFKPDAKTNQPVPTEKYVELSCDMTLPGLASFLTYNLVLVSLCSVFAFKTRKLPDNFNESRFISMCVSTTLVIWLAFIPTYFTATRNFVRVLSLSCALLLNHSVALVFLFIPKIYAAAYVASEEISVTNRFHSACTSVTFSRSQTGNRVAPLTVSPSKSQRI